MPAMEPSERDLVEKDLKELTLMKMHSFFDKEAKENLKRKLQERADFDVQRKANLHFGLALEKQTTLATGIAFSKFIPKHRLRPLQEGEVRYFTVMDSPIDGQVRRSCLFDLATKKARVEYPKEFLDGKLYEPTIYFSADRCMAGRPVLELLTLDVLRALVQYDPWHIFEGFLKKTYVRVGMYYKRLEANVAYRVFAALGGLQRSGTSLSRQPRTFFRMATQRFRSTRRATH